MVLLSVMTSFPFFVAVGVLYGTGYSFLFPSLSSLVVEASAPHERATASSLFHIMFTQGVVLGAFVFSWVAHHGGYALGLRVSAVAPSLLLLFLVVFRRRLSDEP
jgi:predicted MFS family arabinose efflux permease